MCILMDHPSPRVGSPWRSIVLNQIVGLKTQFWTLFASFWFPIKSLVFRTVSVSLWKSNRKYRSEALNRTIMSLLLLRESWESSPEQRTLFVSLPVILFLTSRNGWTFVRVETHSTTGLYGVSPRWCRPWCHICISVPASVHVSGCMYSMSVCMWVCVYEC